MRGSFPQPSLIGMKNNLGEKKKREKNYAEKSTIYVYGIIVYHIPYMYRSFNCSRSLLKPP